MKLALVTAFPPSKITLNEYAYHLTKYFRTNKDVTELVLLTDKTEQDKTLDFKEDGCPISVIECWEFNSYNIIFSVTKALKKVQPDAVLFNLQFMKFGDKKIPAALGLMLPYICKIKRIPNIVLLHNILEQVDLETAGFTKNKVLQKTYNLIGTFLTKLILKADIVAVTMEKYVTILENKYKAKNVRLIPHGTFEIIEETDYSIPKNPMQIMTFGKFGTYKKVELMIEAVEHVRQQTGLDLEIVIAGTDNPNVIGYLKQVEAAYAHVPQLRFTGYVKEEDVPKIFSESAVVIFPYTSTTGSSGVLHQAGSYGKAVVMPNLGDLALLVEHEGYNAEFFKPNDLDSLTQAITNIVTNDAYRIELGKANYKAATGFPMSEITNRYVTHFKTLIAKQ